jgi:hypothetical protein
MPPKIEAYNFKAACQTRDMERHRHVGDGWKNEERIGIESRGDIGTSHGHDGRGALPILDWDLQENLESIKRQQVDNVVQGNLQRCQWFQVGYRLVVNGGWRPRGRR